MTTGFRRDRHAPEFVNSARVHNLYTGIGTPDAEQLFRVDVQKKRQIISIALEALRHAHVSPLHLLRDLFDGGRALGW